MPPYRSPVARGRGSHSAHLRAFRLRTCRLGLGGSFRRALYPRQELTPPRSVTIARNRRILRRRRAGAAMTNPSSILPRWSFAIAAVALVVAACSGGSPTPTPEPTTSASPAPLTPTTPAAEDYIPPSNPTAGAPDDSAEPEGSEVPAGRLVYVGSDGHIYVINADGSERTRISEQAADDAPTAHTWPMWSGHGESVVFSQVVGGAGGPRFFLRSTTVGEGAGPRLVYENPREDRVHRPKRSSLHQRFARRPLARVPRDCRGYHALHRWSGGRGRDSGHRPRRAALLRLDERRSKPADPPAKRLDVVSARQR